MNLPIWQESSPESTLLGLVQRYSPSGQERSAAAWLVDRMAGLGFNHRHIDEVGNAVGVIGHGSKQVVLLGHIDTVPGEIPVRLEDDRLYGRGAVDAKGALACFVEAAAGVGVKPGWQLVVIGAVEEERNSEGARAIISSYQPEYLIAGEPNHWDRVGLGYKGSAWARVSLRRPQAHSAGQRESACEAAIDTWLAIQAWAASYNLGRPRTFDQVLLSLRGFDSAEAGFEQCASLDISARLPPDLPPAAWYARLAEIAGGAESIPTGFAIPAYRCEKNTPLVRAMLAGIRAAGGAPGFVVKTGTSDLNVVGPHWNCPALVYGPGDSALDHTADEHISLEEYRQSIQVLRAALNQLTS